MFKNVLRRKSRQISLIAAALFGFGLAVGNMIVGGACLFLALILDFIYCALAPLPDSGNDKTEQNKN